MVDVLFADDGRLLTPTRIFNVYDPACGTGGMLSVAEDHLRDMNPSARLQLFGQELNPSPTPSAAPTCCSRARTPRTSSSATRSPRTATHGRRFDYMLANPPYGKEWKTIEEKVKRRARHARLRRPVRRWPARHHRRPDPVPAADDLQDEARRRGRLADRRGLQRLAAVLGRRRLGRGEIRRWIIENDWLDAIVGLPDQLFYNTGINTYIWVVTNRKAAERRGQVQLIDARELCAKMRKSLGNKRNGADPDVTSPRSRPV